VSLKTSTEPDEVICPFTAFWLLRLEARCDALAAQLAETREQISLSDREQSKHAVDEMTKALLQKKLETIETTNPSLAAAIAKYQAQTDLPGEYL
jgi:acyl-homoserine lactone acylase PvdQ